MVSPHVYTPPGKPKGAYNAQLAALMFAGKGEVKIESVESDKEYCVGIYADGSWERRKTDVGVFVTKRDDFKLPYLSTEGEPSFEFTLPKLPMGMLEGIADFFKLAMAKLQNAESMVQIFWNKEEEKYSIYVPVQEVSGASISFEHSTELQNDPNMVWVIDIHSHNTMGAFFSGGDDADEKSTRVFGVLGQLNKEDYASVWRAGSNGFHIPLKLEDIWDETQTAKWTIPEKLMDRVTKKVYAAPKYKPYNSGVPGKRYNQNNQPIGGAPVNNSGRVHNVNAYRNSGYGGNPYDYDSSAWGDDYEYANAATAQWMREQTHGAGTVNDGSEVNDYNAWLEVELQKDQLDDLFELVDNGLAKSEDIAETARGFVGYFAELQSFDEATAQAIVDELSANMPKGDFQKLIEMYGN